ncbi:MAG: TetR/AcrR family bet gene transcriptional repressor [Bradymonadia bacterium]
MVNQPKGFDMARASTLERRTQIVEGLKQVMATQGYAGASMRAIAEAAGLTTGLLHYHFANKQAILLGLIAQLADALVARIEPATGRAALEGVIDALLGLSTADPAALACWTQIHAEAQRDPVVGAAWRVVIDARLADFTHQFEGLGRGAPEAVALWAAIEGYVQMAAVCPDAIPTGSAAPMVRAMLEGLLR